MRTIQLIGGPLNGEYVAVEDGVKVFKIVERLDTIEGIGPGPEMQEATETVVRHHTYKQSPDCDFIFYHREQ